MPVRPIVNNNPLNLKLGTYTRKYLNEGAELDPAEAEDGGKFLKFPSVEHGFNAAKDLLFKSPVYANMTVGQALNKWSNGGYSNISNVDANKNLQELSETERSKLITSMAAREGFLDLDSVARRASVMPQAEPPPGHLDLEDIAKQASERTKVEPPPSTFGFLGNVLSSGGRLIGGLADVATHPIDTAKSLGGLAAGAVEKLSPETFGNMHAPMVDAVWNQLKERYGSTDRILKTAYDDPVGMAADVAAIVGGAGAIARGAGAATKVGAVSRVGKALTTASEFVDPIQTALKIGGSLAKGTGAVLKQGAALTSATNPESIRQAFNVHSKTFTDAFRGRIPMTEIVEDFKNAVNDIVKERTANIESGMEGIHGLVSKQAAKRTFVEAAQAQGVKFKLVQPLKGDEAAEAFLAGKSGERVTKELTDVNEIFGKIPQGSKIKLDFSKTPFGLDKSGVNAVRTTFENLRSWKNVQAKGVDTLRRRIQSIIPNVAKESEEVFPVANPARDIVKSTHDALVGTLSEVVPEYESLVEPHKQATRFLNELKSNLSAGNEGAAFKKLQAASKEGNEYHQMLIDALDSRTGQKYQLADKITGYGLSQIKPRFFRAAAMTIPIFWGIGRGLNPSLALELAFTSPRAVAEMANVAGKVTRGVQKIPVPPASVYRSIQYGTGKE